MKKLTVETIIPCLVGVGLVGYAAFRVARGAARIVHEVYVEFVSG